MILLYIITGYLLLSTLILVCNMRDFIPLHPPWETPPENGPPMVSLCIPARNEEDNIADCVESALAQDYPHMEVLVLDDRSSDRTGEVMRELDAAYPGRLILLEGKPLPEGWLGKSWACQQLAEASSGDILLFVDADTRLRDKTVSRTVRTMGRDVVDMLTAWPQQEMTHFWARRVIPLVYHALLTTLPVRWVRRGPKWLPGPLRRRISPLLAAACGQFMAFRREAYEEIGGHAAVRDRIVEDVALARLVKRSGYSMNMYHGSDAVTCRMYKGHREMWEGFRKNFLAGFGGSLVLFAAAGLFSAAVYLAPFLTLLAGAVLPAPGMATLSLLALALIFLQRALLARLYGWDLRNALTHPLGVLWFQALGARVITDRLQRVRPRWKGRPVGQGPEGQ